MASATSISKEDPTVQLWDFGTRKPFTVSL